MTILEVEKQTLVIDVISVKVRLPFPTWKLNTTRLKTFGMTPLEGTCSGAEQTASARVYANLQPKT